MKSLFIILISCSLYFSCGKNDNKTQNTESNPKENTTSTTTSQQPSGKSPEDIRVNFPSGSTEVSLNGSITGFAQNIIYVFEASKGQKLTASVKPKGENANIRIEQIIPPKGDSDGPFSTEMSYSLNESGNWKLVLGEDQMVSNPWKGDYILTLEIK